MLTPSTQDLLSSEKGQEKGVCAERGQNDLWGGRNWRERVQGDAYFTVYFLTLLKTHVKNINGEIQVKS